jgi:hypothetical protein
MMEDAFASRWPAATFTVKAVPTFLRDIEA